MTGVTLPAAWRAAFGSPRMAAALSTASVACALLAFTLRSLMGWPGLVGAVAALVVLCGMSLLARRESIEWSALMPVSLLVFLSWAAVSVVWSEYRGASVAGVAYLLAFTVLALHVALTRDLFQVIRIFGDVLRVVVGLSLAVEVLAGLLLDMPFGFLSVAGLLHEGGPISGAVGNRNELGVVAVIAVATFVVEWRTRSVSAVRAIASVAAAVAVLVFTQSVIAAGVAVVAGVAAMVLVGIRRLPQERRQSWLFVALAGAGATAGILWLMRGAVVASLNATGELNARLGLWQQVWSLVPFNWVQGWGWVGQWNVGVFPFAQLSAGAGRPLDSAANTFLDVWFQLGVIGLGLIVVMMGVAFVRGWLLGARKRSVIFMWPAVVMSALVSASLAESVLFTEFGWLIFVVCCVLVSQHLSWRTAFQRPLAQEPL